MKSAAGQVWYWPGTDEVILILAVDFCKEDGTILFDELNLETGMIWRRTPLSIENDERWERWG